MWSIPGLSVWYLPQPRHLISSRSHYSLLGVCSNLPEMQRTTSNRRLLICKTLVIASTTPHLSFHLTGSLPSRIPYQQCRLQSRAHDGPLRPTVILSHSLSIRVAWYGRVVLEQHLDFTAVLANCTALRIRKYVSATTDAGATSRTTRGTACSGGS